MNRSLTKMCVVAVLATGAGAAGAKGCITGAAVGGAAGHVAGHHAVIGAVAGCAINHHRNAVKDKEAAAAAARSTQGASPAEAPATTAPKQVGARS